MNKNLLIYTIHECLMEWTLRLIPEDDTALPEKQRYLGFGISRRCLLEFEEFYYYGRERESLDLSRTSSSNPQLLFLRQRTDSWNENKN
jgi:hypothetical protein